MSAAERLDYEPVVRHQIDATTAGLLGNTSGFRSATEEVISTLAELGSGLPFDPSCTREEFASTFAHAQAFLVFLCTELGSAFMRPVEMFAPELVEPMNVARRNAADVIRAHAAACALALGTDDATRHLTEFDLDVGARLHAEHNPLFAAYLSLTPEHREVLDSLQK